MKITLYIILGIVVIGIGFFVWFFVFFLQVPELKIPENSSEKEKIVLIDNWLANLNAERKFNGGILIIKDGIPTLAKTYGYTNFQRTEKLNNNASFRLASVSKQFTASGIMLLNEKALIDYDDQVSKYISNFPYQNVTIRNLLNHTSGIPDSYLYLAENAKEDIGILTNEKATKLIVENKPKAHFNPNDQYQYSNTNYILLARIIELVSQQSFENFMKDNIFNPLGMNNTRVWNLISRDKTFQGKTDDFEDLAGETRELKPTFVDGVAGDGGIFSSIDDFVIWDNFWYANNLISDKNMKEAFKKPTLNNGELSNYGFGWLIINEDVVMHDGAWLGANTYFTRNIKTKTSLVLLDNSSNLFFDQIIENIK
ncbi:serine hydrolase domain-containing protein [Winogradskyella bathintestinalis]|uniref:Serine hydrolase domain-containing protein n=1 Tax=Winogradskyella bathintestinalis TaxID=3035208 RepID=A0ABT7ZRT1_9FLAO|nr:serine hydrolase domain-containing protein [Winogradskyella bathintestinalis]MDN3491731.1 serine hydrolase domain-containing protein [Winogradskyella bathintestinalis]